MNEYSRVLRPPDRFLKGLREGTYFINEKANRLVDATGQFVAALVPGQCFNPEQLSRGALAPLAPLIGTAASVIGIGVSVVGFVLVLRRLERMEQSLGTKLNSLASVLREHQDMSWDQVVARVNAAASWIDSALQADDVSTRQYYAREAGKEFEIHKQLIINMWRRQTPWASPHIDVAQALGIHARFVAAATGVLQAAFIAGDMGAFRQSARATAEQAATFRLDAPAALRARCDMLLRGSRVPSFSELEAIGTDLAHAVDVVAFSQMRLAAFEHDADLPTQLGLYPWEIARAFRAAEGDALYAVPLAKLHD